MPSADLSRRLQTIVAARTDGDEEEALQLYNATLRRLDWRRRRGFRTCSRCGLDKKPNAFSVDSRERDGLRRYCRECDRPHFA